MVIKKSLEDYLEMIYILIEEIGYARSVDIAHGLHVTKPSVSHATKRLKEHSYILMDRDGRIHLTQKGLIIAQNMYNRHHLLVKFLDLIGVEQSIAIKDACKLEHGLSEESFEALRKHVEKLQK